jgi:hypothetical protein
MYWMQEDKEFEEVRLGYQLTQPQRDSFDALVRAVDDMTDRMEEAGSVEGQERPGSHKEDPALKRIDKLCLEFSFLFSATNCPTSCALSKSCNTFYFLLSFTKKDLIYRDSNKKGD